MYHLTHFVNRMLLLTTLLIALPIAANLCQPTTNAAIAALCKTADCVDCSIYRAELEKIFVTSDNNDLRIQAALSALQNNPTSIDAILLKEAIQHTLTSIINPELRETAEKVLNLCNAQKTRAMRTSEEEFVLPAVAENLPNVTRSLTDQWVVKKTALGNTVTFDPESGNIRIDQNLAVGASVVFNSVTSTGAALALDAAASNVINIGNTNATAVNIATAGTAATGVSIGTTSTVTDINIGASATTSTIDITGVATVVTGSTSARLDAPTVNIGTTASTDINIGSGTTATIDVVGTNLNIDGTANMLKGNELLFWNPAGTFHSGIKAGVILGTSPATLVLPLVNGSNGNVLTTNGSGVLSWGSSTPTSTSMVDAYRKTSNQTTAAVTEVVKFNQADVNPGGAYDPTATWTYTVPTTGYYSINAQVCVQPVDTGTKAIDLAVGGVAVAGYQSYIVVPTLTNSGNPTIYDTRMINFGCIKQLTSGNLVTISYAGTIGDIILQNASHFSAHLISV